MEWERVEVTPDSGAADTGGPRSIAPSVPIQETAASKGGVSYTVANGESVPNEGQRPIQGFTDSGHGMGITFQVTQVRKLLASVRKICEMGNKVVFDEEGSYVQNKQSGVKTVIDKRNGTYAFNIWIQVPDKVNDMEVDHIQESILLQKLPNRAIGVRRAAMQ